MTVVLSAIGVLLALWGFYTITTLDSIAAIDVGSTIIVGAAIVLGLAGIARALDRLRREVANALLAVRPEGHGAEPEIHVPVAERKMHAREDDTSTYREPVPTVPAPAPELPTPSVRPPAAPLANAPVPPMTASVSRPAPAEPSLPPQVRSPFAPPGGNSGERPIPDFLTRHSGAAAAAGAAAAGSVASAPVGAEGKVDEPELLREGVLNGVSYRFYSDGSVEAEGENGPQRYESVSVLRDEILSRRAPDVSSAALPDQREDPAEDIAPRPFEPLVDNHVGRHDLRAGGDEPLDGDIPVVLPPRTGGVGDDEDVKAPFEEIDRGLQHADMSFEPADDDLAPPLDMEFERSLDEDALFYSRESELGDDDPLAEPVPERGDRWSEALRMLLRRERGDTDTGSNLDEDAAGPDNGVDPRDRRR
jgi:hypothetical protein